MKKKRKARRKTALSVHTAASVNKEFDDIADKNLMISVALHWAKRVDRDWINYCRDYPINGDPDAFHPSGPAIAWDSLKRLHQSLLVLELLEPYLSVGH